MAEFESFEELGRRQRAMAWNILLKNTKGASMN